MQILMKKWYKPITMIHKAEYHFNNGIDQYFIMIFIYK